MSRTRPSFPLRSRLLAFAATAIALVTMSGITAAPAFAAGDVTFTVYDDSTGGRYGEKPLMVQPDGGDAVEIVTAPDGTYSFSGLENGDYTITPTGQWYVQTSTNFTVIDGGNLVDVHVDRKKVTGNVQSWTGGGTATATVQEQLSDDSWSDLVADSVAGDHSFSIYLPASSGNFRVVIRPSESSEYLDSYSDEFTVGDGDTDIGEVGLNRSGFISGTVGHWGTGDPLEGATVIADAESATYETTSDADGNYRIKLPASDGTYLVRAFAPGYLTQYWTGPEGDLGSEPAPIVLDASTSYSWVGIPFLLQPDTTNVSGSAVVDGPEGPEPYDVTFKIFKETGGLFGSTPVYSVGDTSYFNWNDVPLGTYRLAVVDSVTSLVLPWSSYEADEVLESAGGCYIEFSVVDGGVDYFFDSINVDPNPSPSACDEPVWGDPSDGTVSGTVTNYLDLSGVTVASLYRGSGMWHELVDTAVVSATDGSYLLTGVRDAGNYFVGFTPAADDPHLPMLLGAGDPIWDDSINARVAILADPIVLGASESSSGNDIELQGASILSGTVSDGTGDPVEGNVAAESLDVDIHGDPVIQVFANIDENGDYSITLPIGTDVTLRFISMLGEHSDEWWENAETLDDAEHIASTIAGENGPFDFDVSLAPPSLYGYLTDTEDPGYDFTVHLYANLEGGWTEIDQNTSFFDNVFFYKNYETEDYTGLIPGHYRMRFQDDEGNWLAANSYWTGVLPDTGSDSPLDGPVCYVDFDSVEPGMASYIHADFNRGADAGDCGPQPQGGGDVTGTLVESEALGGDPIADHPVFLYDSAGSGSIGTTTDADGDFVFSSIPDGTYELRTTVRPHLAGEHSYVTQSTYNVVVQDGLEIGSVALTRYGNISGTIEDWDPVALGGTTVVARYLDDLGRWVDSSSDIEVEVDSSGHFEVPGIDVDGEYSLFFTFPSGYIGQYYGGGFYSPGATFAGDAEEDVDLSEFELTPIVSTTISGNVHSGGTPLMDGAVFAHIAAEDDAVFFAETDADGNYSIDVVPGYSYEVGAIVNRYKLQVWNGHDVVLDEYGDADFEADLVDVGPDPATNIDFNLVPIDLVDFDLLLEYYDPAEDEYFDFDDVTVHLYKQIDGGWLELDSDVSDPEALVSGLGEGDYRLRFSTGDDWLAVDDLRWSNWLQPYTDSDGFFDFDPDECYIQFDDVLNGSGFEIDSALNPDPSAIDCGAEAVPAGTVTGTLVESEELGGDPVAGQEVTLYAEGVVEDLTDDVVQTVTTGTNGRFAFTEVPDGEVNIAADTRAHVSGEHSYMPFSGWYQVDDSLDLGELELTRYGNIIGEIADWDPVAMAGTTVQAYEKIDNGGHPYWAPVGPVGTVDPCGCFEAPGIYADGEYSVKFSMPDGYITGFYGGGVHNPNDGDELDGEAEQDLELLPYEPVDAVTISGTIRSGATPLQDTVVLFTANDGVFDDFPVMTGSDGTYSVDVPAGHPYVIRVEALSYKTQFWNGHNYGVLDQAGPPDYDLFEVETDDVADLDFDLVAEDSVIWDQFLQQLDAAGDATDADDVTVHLYKKVGEAWTEVDYSVSSPDYEVGALGGGDYRFRFERDGAWLAVSQLIWFNHLQPYTNIDDPELLDPARCFYDFEDVATGSYYDGWFSLAYVQDLGCSAEPQAAPTGTTTTVTPPKKPKPGATLGTLPLPTPTATPAAEPTATPTPEPSATEEPGDDAAGPTDIVPVRAPDLAWLFWLFGILLVVILAGGAILIFRRR